MGSGPPRMRGCSGCCRLFCGKAVNRAVDGRHGPAARSTAETATTHATGPRWSALAAFRAMGDPAIAIATASRQFGHRRAISILVWQKKRPDSRRVQSSSVDGRLTLIVVRFPSIIFFRVCRCPDRASAGQRSAKSSSTVSTASARNSACRASSSLACAMKSTPPSASA